MEDLQKALGEVLVVLSAVTVAEIGHGIYRANTPEIRQRRRMFLDDLKATVPSSTGAGNLYSSREV